MKNTNRRDFLRLSTFALASLPFAGFLSNRATAAAKTEACPSQIVSEDDAVAKAIGYKHDVKNIDFAKFPARKKPENKNQFCDNCSIYTKLNAACGKCTMIASGAVNSKGWCGSWAKK